MEIPLLWPHILSGCWPSWLDSNQSSMESEDLLVFGRKKSNLYFCWFYSVESQCPVLTGLVIQLHSNFLSLWFVWLCRVCLDTQLLHKDAVEWLVRGMEKTWWTNVSDATLDGLVGRWEINISLICCQVNWSLLKNAYTTILKISRTQKTVLSSGLFTCVSLFSPKLQLLQHYALFLFQAHLISVVSVSLGFSLVCVCVFGYFGFCFSLLLDLCGCSWVSNPSHHQPW